MGPWLRIRRKRRPRFLMTARLLSPRLNDIVEAIDDRQSLLVEVSLDGTALPVDKVSPVLLQQLLLGAVRGRKELVDRSNRLWQC